MHGWAKAWKDQFVQRLLADLELFNGVEKRGSDEREGGGARIGKSVCHAKELGFVPKTRGSYGRIISKGMT